MEPNQPYNIVVAEIDRDGEVLKIMGKAATANDDAIQFVVDFMASQEIGGERVMRLYAERQPSPEWYAYFAKHWPNVAVTWSFGPHENDKMEMAVGSLLEKAQRPKPWWKFW